MLGVLQWPQPQKDCVIYGNSLRPICRQVNENFSRFSTPLPGPGGLVFRAGFRGGAVPRRKGPGRRLEETCCGRWTQGPPRRPEQSPPPKQLKSQSPLLPQGPPRRPAFHSSFKLKSHPFLLSRSTAPPGVEPATHTAQVSPLLCFKVHRAARSRARRLARLESHPLSSLKVHRAAQHFTQVSNSSLIPLFPHGPPRRPELAVGLPLTPLPSPRHGACPRGRERPRSAHAHETHGPRPPHRVFLDRLAEGRTLSTRAERRLPPPPRRGLGLRRPAPPRPPLASGSGPVHLRSTGECLAGIRRSPRQGPP